MSICQSAVLDPSRLSQDLTVHFCPCPAIAGLWILFFILQLQSLGDARLHLRLLHEDLLGLVLGDPAAILTPTASFIRRGSSNLVTQVGPLELLRCKKMIVYRLGIEGDN